jgi:vanillate/4-hydroxybenzoate decarboxylase subunit D
MTTPTAPATPSICPRCGSKTVTTLASSPVSGVWTVFQCTTCLYTWRSSEPAENTDPQKYPMAFRLDPKGLSGLAVIPAVPPKRQPQAAGK